MVCAAPGLLLWALTGWTWTVLAAALAAALVLHVLGFLLPRRLHDRAGAIAPLAAVLVLITQSSPWAVLLCVGLAGAGLAFTQLGTTRTVALIAGAAIAAVGAVGLAHQAVVIRTEHEAAHRTAGDYARGQMLPDDPSETIAELMRRVARGDGDPATCALMFDEQGRVELARAYQVPNCPAALQAAGAAISDPVRYRDRIDLASIKARTDPTAPRAEVDGCRVRWRENALGEILTGSTTPRPVPGPPLGRFTLAPVPGGWVVTGVNPC